jgi:nucleoside-diphosphate-sugar epimerase
MAGSAVTSARLGNLHTDERIVVTGGSGWLGLSLLHNLAGGLGSTWADRVLVLGSAPRTIPLLGGQHVEVHAWRDTAVAAWDPTLVVHLACLTPDRLVPGSDDQYARTNAELSDRGFALRELPSVRGFVVASSGAATRVGDGTPLGAHSYALQRAVDEDRALAPGSKPTVVARTWSVSGPYCTRPSAFAFSSFVQQALAGGPVRVGARGRVYRRYVDAGEYLALALNGAAAGLTGLVDSTGSLVEMRELAHDVAHELGGEVRAGEPESGVHDDRYFSDSPVMDEWAAEQGVAIMDLPAQIRFTASGLGAAH